MLTLFQRRRAAQTMSGLARHQQGWRECANADRFDDGDGLDAARGIFAGCALGALAWAALLALLVWSIELLAR